MERHMRDVLEDEVTHDPSLFGLLNNQDDDTSTTPVLLLENKHKPRNRKLGKLLRTGALCGAYISLGLCYSVTGPTLLFLKEQVGTTMSEISYIFTARSLGSLFGAFLGGALLDKCNPYSTFFSTIAMMGISVGAMPWFKHLWALMASSVAIGISNGLLDTGASTLCLQLWGKESGPYMQSLHFAFAIGGSIAPLLVQAFVDESKLQNQVLSSRHTRSVTEPFILNSSDINNFTSNSIIFATTQIPILALTNATETASTAANATTITIPISAMNSTTSTLSTTLATEKPKKPKPSIINGQILGDSSQFENIPLKNEPVLPDVTSTTSSSTTQITSTISSSTVPSTTQSSSTLVSGNISSNVNSTESQLQRTGGTNFTESAESSNKTTSVDVFTLENSESNSQPNKSLVTDNGSTIQFKENSTVPELVPSQAINPVDTHLNGTDDANASSFDASLPATTPKPSSSTTSSSAPTSTTTPASTTTQVLATSPVSTTIAPLMTPTTPSIAPKTETVSPITLVVSSTRNDSFITSTTTTTTDASATKSRGKNRGQQEESNFSAPTMEPKLTDHEPPTTVTNADITQTSHPSIVIDYMERFGVTRMHMLYTVIAIIVLHTSFAFLFFLCSSGSYSASLNAERHAGDRKVRPFRPKARLLFVTLMFFFYLMYVGGEVVFSQYLATFTLEKHTDNGSTSTANFVTTSFWAAFAVGRFAAIFIAHFITASQMLYFNLGITTLGAVILSATAQSSVVLLYLGSALVGFGMAPIFATGFVWTEMHLIVTNRISAAFCFGSSMGEMFFPTVTGSLIEAFPNALMYEVLGSTLLCVLTLLAAGYLANHKSKRGSDNPAGYHLACQTEELTQH